MVTRLYLIKNGKKILVDEVQMYLSSLISIKTEYYQFEKRELVIDGIHIYYGCGVNRQRDKRYLSGSYALWTDNEFIAKHETISSAFFDLQSLKKTCFTFLFYDDVFLSIEIERSDDE